MLTIQTDGQNEVTGASASALMGVNTPGTGPRLQLELPRVNGGSAEFGAAPMTSRGSRTYSSPLSPRVRELRNNSGGVGGGLPQRSVSVDASAGNGTHEGTSAALGEGGSDASSTGLEAPTPRPLAGSSDRDGTAVATSAHDSADAGPGPTVPDGASGSRADEEQGSGSRFRLPVDARRRLTHKGSHRTMGTLGSIDGDVHTFGSEDEEEIVYRPGGEGRSVIVGGSRSRGRVGPGRGSGVRGDSRRKLQLHGGTTTGGDRNSRYNTGGTSVASTIDA